MKTSRIVLLSAVLVGLFAVAQKALSQTPIAVDPKATYLLTHDDAAGVNAIPIPLASLAARTSPFPRKSHISIRRRML
jgi:hypothetical protein